MKQMKMISALLACVFLICAPAFGEQLSNVDLSERINKLEEQMKQGILPAGWAERVTLSGAIELEAGYERLEFDDPAMEEEESSDFSLATVELGVDVKIMEHVSGFALFKYEDDEDVFVDEGFILLEGNEAFPLYLKAGKLYVPFGKFESNMISDPLTLELGETRETAVEIGFSHYGFYSAVYAFNGDVDKEDEENHIDNFGAALGYAMETEAFTLDVGVSWINNIVDADFNTDVMEEEGEVINEMGMDFALRDYVPGFGVHAVLTAGPVTLIGEYITMLDESEWSMSDMEPGAMEIVGNQRH